MEHFLLRLARFLPDMEMLINVHDYPQSSKLGPPMPIFSFSKVVSTFDITGFGSLRIALHIALSLLSVCDGWQVRVTGSCSHGIAHTTSVYQFMLSKYSNFSFINFYTNHVLIATLIKFSNMKGIKCLGGDVMWASTVLETLYAC